MKKNGMGSHQSSVMMKDEWLTPPEIIKSLGTFNLDPCSPVNRVWDTAADHMTIHDDGLSQLWLGRVWMNPPYGQQTGKWLKKLRIHGDGVALVFARTETKMFFSEVWPYADSIFFFEGRLYFHHSNGEKAYENAGAPSCLIAYGENNTEAIKKSGLSGKLVYLRK